MKQEALKSLVLAIVVIALCIDLTACSNSDDDNDMTYYPANAEGVYCCPWTDTCGEPYYYWIDEYVILQYSSYLKETTIKSRNAFRANDPYFPMDMDIVYGSLSEQYGREITEDTDLSKLNPDPSYGVQYIKSHKSMYKYISVYSPGTFNLFNRISSVNY